MRVDLIQSLYHFALLRIFSMVETMTFLLPLCGKIPQRCFTQAFTITFALGFWATLDHLRAS
jgi:hypothetical protein